MRVLHGALEDYRAAATAFGVPWPVDGDPNGGLSPDELCPILDVDHIPEQLIWLRSAGLPNGRVFPGGMHLLDSSTGVDDLLGFLSLSLGTPFHWRHQLPILVYDHIVYTFVLAEGNEGEIWRYQIDPDEVNPARAAASLAALFTEWTKGFAAGVYFRSPYNNWIHIGDGDPDGEHDPVNVLLARAPDLDPFAFPVSISTYPHEGLIRARQRECGVDLDRIDVFEYHEELHDAVDAVRASLRTPWWLRWSSVIQHPGG